MDGAILTLVDRDQAMTHPDVRRKLEAAGYGIFVPVFFVTSGIRFDADALFASGESASRVPIFLVALLLIGIELGALDEATGAAFVAAGLLSVLLFPLAALTILRRSETADRGHSCRPVDAGA